MIESRWESGSEFHFPSYAPTTSVPQYPWGAQDSQHHLWGCGRDALLALLWTGRSDRGWKRVWCPDYFCQEVIESMLNAGLPIVLYPDLPSLPTPNLDTLPLQPGDAVLVMNYFGLRARPMLPQVKGVEWIEDHSHDLFSDWAFNSQADWCVASLRKTLPLPDGGALWSPAGHIPPLPPRLTTPTRRNAAHLKFAAMQLKSLYLNGHQIEKDIFRSLSLEAEASIANGPPSTISNLSRTLLQTFPVMEWREAKRQNYTLLCKALKEKTNVTVLKPHSLDAAVPLSLALLCDTPQLRMDLRAALIQANIYPAMLWSLEDPTVDGTSPESLDFSRRILNIHCDSRYNQADISRIIDLLLKHL